jgi:hypothetical protein
VANGHGGARTGSGKPAGSKNKATISKEEGRELVRQEVLKNIGPMLRSQMQHAIGIQHMMLRQKDGTFKRAEKVEDIEAALNSGDKNSYYLFTKDPSTQAFTDLLNRALDKPKEQEQEVTVAGKLVIEIAKGW